MRGDTLYPLHQLKGVFPEVAGRAAQKYAGREFVLERRVEPLACRWNDCLMFSPVHPEALMNALRESGRQVAPSRWFEVSAHLLGPAETVIYLSKPWPDSQVPAGPEDYFAFEPASLERFMAPSAATLQRLRDRTQRLILFLDVAHVLHRGTLNVGGLRVIEVG